MGSEGCHRWIRPVARKVSPDWKKKKKSPILVVQLECQRYFIFYTEWYQTDLNSIGVAMKLASIMLGAWQRWPSSAIANPQRNTVTPVKKQNPFEANIIIHV